MNLYPTTLVFADALEAPQTAAVSGATLPVGVGTSAATVATATIAGNVITVSPVGIGTATITVTDSASSPNVLTIAVTVVSTSASIGEIPIDYLAGGGSSPPAIIFTDLQIQETYPGIEFNALEVGGEWVEVREVNGDFWLVTNAHWDGSAWGFVNSSVDAYALKLGSDGSAVRYFCRAGTLIFAWTAFWQFDSMGDLAAAIGTTLTSAAQVALAVSPIWNTVGGTPMRARVVNITDTASPTNSLLDDLQVSSVSKWSVRKDGVLIAGSVPLQNVSGLRSGSVTSVPVDAAGFITVSFASPFVVSTSQVLTTPIWATLGDSITAVVRAPTTVGFSVYCAGGPVGGLCTVSYLAVGT